MSAFKFLSKTLPAFGLDVSAGSLKLLELKGRGKDLVVQAYSEAEAPKGLVQNDAVADLKTFEFLLKQSLQKAQFGRFGTSYVVASLPESKSFVRVIQIPQMSESEADNAVPFEAESFIPLPVDQVYLDWEKIGDSGDKMDVLMIASPKAFVDGYLDMLDKAGLKPVALEVESQSCRRAVLPPGSGETALLVDIEGGRTSMIMVENGSLQFTSTIPVAGNSFTESIATSLGVSAAKASDIKKRVGIANTAEYPNIKIALLPVLNSLAAEIKNILKFHNEHSNKQVERVILSGGGARLRSLLEFLTPQLQEAGINKVELANPLQNLGVQQAGGLDQLQALGFTTAIGLALRGAKYQVE